MTSSCWLWIGGKDKDGYGKFKWVNGKDERAHRFSWLFFRGPIPESLFVLHKCDNTSCVNPDHLFLGTHAMNMGDKKEKGRQRNQYKNASHCIHGHEFTAENTYHRKDGGRNCRRCTLDASKKAL
jgi:hypothetical protein